MELSFKLQLPDGQAEEIRVSSAKDGVAVLLKVLKLSKKHECLRALDGDIDFEMPDGKILDVDEPIQEQGLQDGDVLIVKAQSASTESTAEVSDASSDKASEEDGRSVEVVSACAQEGDKAEFYLESTQIQFNTSRGLNVVTIDPNTQFVLSKATYDTGASATESARFAADIRALPEGRLVLVALMGSGMDGLTAEAKIALETIGATVTVTCGEGCQSFAFIGTKGGAKVAQKVGAGTVTARGSLFREAPSEERPAETSEQAEEEEVDPGGHSVEDAAKALKWYSKQFSTSGEGAVVDGEKQLYQRKSFPFGRMQTGQEELSGVARLALEREAFGPAGAGAPAAVVPGQLLHSFGYAGSLDPSPVFARFDVRDEACLAFGGFKHNQVVRDLQTGRELVVVGVRAMRGATPRLWFQPLDLGRHGAGTFPGAVTPAALQARLALLPREHCLVEVALEDFDVAEDSDGEDLTLCRQCKLPVGECAYTCGEGKSGIMHGECAAQHMLLETKKEERIRSDGEKELKMMRRSKYEIGWRAERLPRTVIAAKKLDIRPLPQGMCSLVLHQDSDSISIAPTLEAAAAVNLEYLSIALQVRIKDGREPWFSLDPVDPANPNSMQFKRFEPAWLAGTSVGEVLFQSDYHLKELSMGECGQPVIGMKSAFELSEEERSKEEWNAREWFVVRHAEVQQTEDNILVPCVRMGVEAREQVLGKDGRLQDAKLTRHGHPLVKYAESFTHNFDLIAERKSVIFHLRELAKAAVMAKYLVESGIEVDSAIVNMADEKRAACPMEIPQLWNERFQSQVHLKDGVIADVDNVIDTSIHGIYGGVAFGLERFSLARPGVPGRSVLAGVATRPGLRAPLTARAARMAFQPQVLMPSARAAPKGVDLNLGQFSLNSASQAARKGHTWGDADACVAMGHAFFSSLDGGEAVFKPEDASFLQALFNPLMSDRRDEGASFVPPDTSLAYAHRLRSLLSEEQAVQRERTAHFCSTSFAIGRAGPLFPASWTPDAPAKARPHGGMLLARPAYTAHVPVIEQILKSAAPVFDETTEDGLQFRIYRLGSLEVRTTQARGGKEAIGAVFSIRAPAQDCQGLARDEEKIVKATEYVAYAGAQRRRSYVVLETEQAHMLVTEQLQDKEVVWEESPVDLDDRVSLSKVVRSADCKRVGVTIAMMKAHGVEGSCKCYAHSVFNRARGDSLKNSKSGFFKRPSPSAWNLNMHSVSTAAPVAKTSAQRKYSEQWAAFEKEFSSQLQA